MKKNLFVFSLLLATFFLTGTFEAGATNVCGTVDLGGINLGFGNSDCLSATTGYGAFGWGGVSNIFGLPGGSIIGIITNLLFWLLAIFAILGIVGFVLAGIMFVTASGDTSQYEKAKKTAYWSVIGILVGLSGFIVIQAVSALLSGANNRF